MTQLFSPVPRPPPQIGFVAVAINQRATHIALLYRLKNDDAMRMLHLGWDHDLRNDEISPRCSESYLGTTLAIGPLRAKQVAHYCLSVFEANPEGIPYGFGNPFGSFNANREFVPGTQRVGLTCASFIVAVLEQAGINLVDRSVWGSQPDDEAFFAWTIRVLKGEIPGYPAATRPDHPAAIEAQVAAGAVRYRPIEVGGAATSETIPVSFTRASQLGEILKTRLTRANETPPHML